MKKIVDVETMNLSAWASPFIFLAGYTPLMLILLVKDLDFKIWRFANPIQAGIVFALMVLSIALTVAALKFIKGGLPITVTKSQESTGSLMEYSLPYISSFLEISIGDLKDMAVLGIFLVLLYFVALRTKTLFHSPMLIVLGYRLYSVDYLEYGREKNGLILTRRKLHKDDVCFAENFAPETLFVSDERIPGKTINVSQKLPETPKNDRLQGGRDGFVGGSSFVSS